VCAGITTQYLERIFEKDIRVIRIMPNLPVTIGEGISGLCAGRYAKKGDLEFARKVFSSFGEVVEVEERLMDAVTGVSGSSPAYIALVIEALIEAGVKVGLSRDTSMKLILQTALGTCKLLKETGLHPAILRERVTSPGGTTASGVSVLEEHGVRGSFIKAVEEAVKRSGELAAIDEPK
jgi:pyrroline-5-carboxylate reductase